VAIKELFLEPPAQAIRLGGLFEDNLVYENSSVGRASPPANRIGGQGRPPHQHLPFSIFGCVQKEMTAGMSPAGEKDHGTKSFTFSLFFSIIYVNTFTLREI
jgi:hypothetical protein